MKLFHLYNAMETVRFIENDDFNKSFSNGKRAS